MRTLTQARTCTNEHAHMHITTHAHDSKRTHAHAYILTYQIVAELECFSSHDSVKKSGELKLGANWTTAGASLDLGTLAGKRLLRILFASEWGEEEEEERKLEPQPSYPLQRSSNTN